MYFILSVTVNGVISLWDTKEARNRGAADEFHVDLMLTDAQLAKINEYRNYLAGPLDPRD
jgi:hypothetical protein